MSERDPFLVSMEERCQVNDPLDMDEPDDDEPSQAERLVRPKFDVIGPRERLEQLCASAMSVYHITLCSLIEERIGPGEPLQTLLLDSWVRSRANLKARQL